MHDRQPTRGTLVVLALLLAVVAGAVLATTVAATSHDDVTPGDHAPGVATNHTWVTHYDGTTTNTTHNVTLDYSGSGADLSSVTASDLSVELAGSTPAIDGVTVSGSDDILHIDVNDTAPDNPDLQDGDRVTVAILNDAVVNPSDGGDYGVSIALQESGSTFHTAQPTLSIHQYLRGTVTNDSDGALGGATVSVDNQTTGYGDSTTTDGNGEYELLVPVGTYDVTAFADDHSTEQVTGVSVDGGAATTLNFSLTELGTIEGRVLDNGTDTGISGVDVLADDGQGTFGSNVTDGDGNFTIHVQPGTYNVSATPDLYTSGEATGVQVTSGGTVETSLSHTRIAHGATVRHVGGTTPTTMPSVSVSEVGGMVQVDLQNESSSVPQELASLGVDNTTEFRVAVNLTDEYEPRLLVGSMRNGSWERTANGTGTDVVIEGSPTEQQLLDGEVSLQNWPEGSDDRADFEYEAMFSASIDPLDYEQMDEAHAERLNGSVLMTDAQAFSSPRYESAGGTDTLTLTIGGPHYTVGGDTNGGFYEAFLPNSLLDDWGVSGADDLSAAYKGSDSAFDATEVDGGIRLSLNVTYSVGDVELSPRTDGVSDDTDDTTSANLRVASVSALDGEYAVDEAYAVEATVENTGDAGGSMLVDLTANGEGRAATSVTVGAGESVTVTLSDSIAEVGTYDLAVEGVDAGTIEVVESTDDGDDGTGGATTGDGTETDDGGTADGDATGAGTSETDAEGSGSSDGQPGFGIAIAVLALLGAAGLRLRREP